MFDFSRLLTPNQIQCIAETQQTMDRLYTLPDRFLARELVRLARDARTIAIAANDAFVKDPTYPTYNSSLLWSLVPEIAYRLGETDFQPNERHDADLRSESLITLRYSTATILRYSDIAFRYGHDDKPVPNACRIIGHETCNGNPVAIAIDRLCPPNDQSEDQLAKHLREVGQVRFGRDTNITSWSPTFMNYK